MDSKLIFDLVIIVGLAFLTFGAFLGLQDLKLKKINLYEYLLFVMWTIGFIIFILQTLFTPRERLLGTSIWGTATLLEFINRVYKRIMEKHKNITFSELLYKCVYELLFFVLLITFIMKVIFQFQILQYSFWAIFSIMLIYFLCEKIHQVKCDYR